MRPPSEPTHIDNSNEGWNTVQSSGTSLSFCCAHVELCPLRNTLGTFGQSNVCDSAVSLVGVSAWKGSEQHTRPKTGHFMTSSKNDGHM